MTKTVSFTANEIRQKLRDVTESYGAGIQLKVDKDWNIEPYNDPDLSEETPEESEKRAERQATEAKKREDKEKDLQAKIDEARDLKVRL